VGVRVPPGAPRLLLTVDIIQSFALFFPTAPF
jgi:hypothetical protein